MVLSMRRAPIYNYVFTNRTVPKGIKCEITDFFVTINSVTPSPDIFTYMLQKMSTNRILSQQDRSATGINGVRYDFTRMSLTEYAIPTGSTMMRYTLSQPMQELPRVIVGFFIKPNTLHPYSEAEEAPTFQCWNE